MNGTCGGVVSQVSVETVEVVVGGLKMAMGCPLRWYHVQTVNTAGCWFRFVVILPLDKPEKTVHMTIDLVETVHSTVFTG